MTRYYRRRRPGARETAVSAAAAAALAAGVGAVTFYLVRLFLSRERLGLPPSLPSSDEDGAGGLDPAEDVRAS